MKMNTGTYTGSVLGKLPNGIGKIKYNNGNWYNGNWVSGIKQGIGK